MTPTEAGALLDFAIAVGAWSKPDSIDLRHDQIAAWSMVLDEIPYDAAEDFVRTWDSPYKVRPSQIAGAWREDQKRQRAANASVYNERACPWDRLCVCSHEPDVCNRGWRDEPEDRAPDDGHTPKQRWCPRCWDARNLVRADAGKDPLPVGAVTR